MLTVSYIQILNGGVVNGATIFFTTNLHGECTNKKFTINETWQTYAGKHSSLCKQICTNRICGTIFLI